MGTLASRSISYVQFTFFNHYFTGLYYETQEIIPSLLGIYRFNKAGERIKKFNSLEVEVRALIEGQFIAKRAYAEDIGFHTGKFC